MANTVRNKRGTGSDPSASDLVLGEIAVRTDTGQLFVKKDNGSVASIAGGISDGDKGDVTVSNSGATFTIDNDAVTYAKIQNVSATNRILGRDSSGAGVIEEITPASLRTMLNVADGATNVTNTNQLTNGAGFITATLTNEQVQDIVGGMVSGNTETGISVTYQDSDGTLDFVVSSQTDENFTTTLKNKLDGIAASATNVTNNNQLTNGAGYITSTLTQEQVEDFVGGMVSGNTETGITVTYQDSDGTLDFVVASQTDNNFTTTLKNKLDGIASGATNVTNTNQLTNGAGFITATLTNEQVQDIVGGMVSGNTETGITVTYQDSDGTLDFAVASQTDNNFTTTLKNKLDGIAASATNVTNNNQISNGAGYVTSSVINSLNASNLSSGTIPDARFPSTLPAVSGANLTNISATVAGGAIYENAQTISSNYTITNGKNAMSAGPITINSGVTVTVGSGETYTIV
tara:strand:+ start:2041 stop:3426 length:1386 start_codon:yes stop_codon:yes gene_type:complete